MGHSSSEEDLASGDLSEDDDMEELEKRIRALESNLEKNLKKPLKEEKGDTNKHSNKELKRTHQVSK